VSDVFGRCSIFFGGRRVWLGPLFSPSPLAIALLSPLLTLQLSQSKSVKGDRRMPGGEL
jgi:hypothetical protein